MLVTWVEHWLIANIGSGVGCGFQAPRQGASYANHFSTRETEEEETRMFYASPIIQSTTNDRINEMCPELSGCS